MKTFGIFISLLILAGYCCAQTIKYEDFKAVIPILQKEDYKTAFEKTSTLLTSTQKDSSDLRGIVTYMNIYAAAGMVSTGAMTFPEFQTVAGKYVGQRVVMSAHPCVDSSVRSYNALQFVSNDGVLEGMTITTNNRKTNILGFEYFSFANDINPAEWIGKNVRCSGTLALVETNPNNSKAWIMRLNVINALVKEVPAQ